MLAVRDQGLASECGGATGHTEVGLSAHVTPGQAADSQPGWGYLLATFLSPGTHM